MTCHEMPTTDVNERRLYLLTDGSLGSETAVSKTAARRIPRDQNGLAPEDDLVSPTYARFWHGGKQSLGIGVPGIVEYATSGCHLQDATKYIIAVRSQT